MADQEIITRKQARAAGSKFYFTGKPCINGHIAKRYVLAGCYQCCLEKKETSQRRQRSAAATTRWRLKNPDKVRAYRQTYAKTSAATRRRRYAENPEKHLEAARAWRKANHDKMLVVWRNQHALRRAAEGTHSPEDIAAIRKAQYDRCAICKVPLKGKGVVDHIVPLAKGGTNDRRNMQLACNPCNRAKWAKLPEDFMRERGLLL